MFSCKDSFFAPPYKEVISMASILAKRDHPDLNQSIDLQTGFVCRIWL